MPDDAPPVDHEGSDHSPVTLRERLRLATRAEISDAALDLFERHGIEATTVQDIADVVGVSARTCFRYFPSKEEFVLTLHEEFDDAFDAWLSTPPGPEPLLRQLEDVFARVIADLAGPRSTALERLLRVRRLIVVEPALRHAAIRLDADRATDIAERIRARFPERYTATETQIAAEIAQLGLRITFDRWAGRVESGGESSLPAVYEEVRGVVSRTLLTAE